KLFMFVGLALELLCSAGLLEAQDLGHKMPGVIGLDAGKIPEPGLYIVDRVVAYNSDQVRDRNGNIIPLEGLELQALSNAVGISYTLQLEQSRMSLTATAAVPATRFRLNILDRPEASVDRFGLADIYIQPVRLGWQNDHFDVVTSYSVYL